MFDTEKGASPDSPTGVEEQDLTAAAGVRADEGDKAPEGELHKSDRWKEVYGENKQYKELGAVDDLRAKLQRLDYYDQLAADASADAGREADVEPPTEDEAKAAKQAKAIRKELEKVAPELANISSHDKVFNLYFASVEAGAAWETERLMKEAGLPSGERDLVEMSGVLADVIGRDKKLYLTYVRNPETAVNEAWKRVMTKFGGTRAAAAAIQKDKEKLKGLPATHKGGGASGEGAKAPTEPKTLDEAHARVRERLKTLGV